MHVFTYISAAVCSRNVQQVSKDRAPFYFFIYQPFLKFQNEYYMLFLSANQMVAAKTQCYMEKEVSAVKIRLVGSGALSLETCCRFLLQTAAEM